ncbi:MAG: TIGR02301 family protein [Rhodomicrobium sp.]
MSLGRTRNAKAAIYAGVALALMAAGASPVPAQTSAVPKTPPAAAPQKPAGGDDRPYDTQLFRLAEILGTLHYLRELCGASEGQAWREHMRELVAAEGTSTLRRAKLVESFNRGYRDYSRTYRTCTQPALVAIQRFMDQASGISDGLLANDK